MFLLEFASAAYGASAANEAEKRADVKLVYAATLGASGRLMMSGRDSDVVEGKAVALTALGA